MDNINVGQLDLFGFVFKNMLFICGGCDSVDVKEEMIYQLEVGCLGFQGLFFIS